jgi:hypothetical protein
MHCTARIATLFFLEIHMNVRNPARWLALGLAAALPLAAQASSHREAPAITATPKVDGTDFYMFRSYEPTREGYITLIANYLPLQDRYGGPNYFTLDPDAVYDIHIDNDADAQEDITFRFRFTNRIQDIALPVGTGMNPPTVAVPLVTTAPGGIGPGVTDRTGLNVIETYTVDVIRGARTNQPQPLANAAGGANPTIFTKPIDNVGNKSIPNYASYAASHIYSVSIPGCQSGRVFVGQRKESFAVNLGEVFDLIATNPVGAPDGEANIIADKNITSLILEVPTACLTANSDPVIGGWTSASLPQGLVRNSAPLYTPANGRANATVQGGALVQVSRLGGPLVNEVVIGLRDKDRFNASKPVDDPQFITYVTNPTLPKLIETLFPIVKAPTNFPRQDLVNVFLTGIPGVTKSANYKAPGEMLRLNTSLGITARADQKNLGVLGGDVGGFPNGRRPGDDVVDIELRAAMGVLCTLGTTDALALVYGCRPADAPNGGLPYTDGATVSSLDFDNTFPYLRTPLAGATAN